jgi:hypothetical protein
MLLTRNSAVAFVPGAAVVCFLGAAGAPRWARLAGVLCCCVLPTGVWWLVRYAMGQIASHPLSFHGVYGPLDYIVQFAGDLVYRFGPDRLCIGGILFASLCVCLVLTLLRTWPKSAGAFRITVFALAGSLGLLGLFNVTRVHDPLSGRFLLFLPLSLVCALGAVADQVQARVRTVGVVCLCAVVAVQCMRTGTHVWLRLSRPAPGLVPWNAAIRPGYVGRAPIASGSSLLVSPPDFPWLSRYRPSADGRGRLGTASGSGPGLPGTPGP